MHPLKLGRRPRPKPRAMAVESSDDMMAFFSPEEFGEKAVIHSATVDLEIIGIPDTMAETQRPGDTANSGRSPFLAGAADFTMQELQFTTPFVFVHQAEAAAENTLTILAGIYAGEYRIKDIQRDGEICRLMLNKL